MANYKKSLNHTQTGHSNPTFCDRRRTGERNLEHESREWSEWSEWSDWSKSYVTFVTNVTNVTNATNATNLKQEMAIRGDAPRPSVSSSLCLFDSLSLLLADSSLLRATQKSNNFERFFSDSTLTFLTFGNTLRLPILPTRHIILLCLPLI